MRHAARWQGLFLGALAALLALFAITPTAEAHAILTTSTPAINSKVSGRDVPISLRFNVRVDAARSRLTLVGPDAKPRPLQIAKQDSPNVLASQATQLKPGAYRIRWQVLASDGHITRGEVPFTVTGS